MLLTVDDRRVGVRRETDAVESDGGFVESEAQSVNSVVGSAGGVVQARDVGGDVVINNYGASSGVRGRHRVGVVPARAGCFQDRAVTAELAQAIAENESVVLVAPEPASTRVLSGLGGVGKTQLAADYAERAWAAGDIDLLVWVAAGSRDAIVSTYATAASELGWHSDGDTEHGARRFHAALAATSKRWLVVLDDLSSPGDLLGLWPPHSPTGKVVATTRRRDAALIGDRRRVVPVGVFTRAESQSYLTAKLADHRHLMEGAVELAGDLGYLPLALAQAAAYLIDEDLTCHEYRPLLADRRRRLAELLPEPGALPDDHRETVTAILSLSIEVADRMRPAGLAPRVLEVAAVLDSSGTPVAVFTSRAVLAHLANVLARGITADEVRAALRCLHRLNLATVDFNEPHRAVRVHALVQRATREQLTEIDLGTVARAAADSLLETWPDIERDIDLAQVLRSNTDTLHAIATTHLWEPDAHKVLFRAGRSFGEKGQVTGAQVHFEQLHNFATEHLGPDHPHSLATRNNLAVWRGRAGDVAGAIAEFVQVLADELRVLGPDHPGTLTTRNNLASLRGEAGDAAEAVREYEQVLADELRVLGPDHPDTLRARNNLAVWRGEAGDVAGAIAEFEPVLADRLRVLGPDHPGTLRTRSNLDHWRKVAQRDVTSED